MLRKVPLPRQGNAVGAGVSFVTLVAFLTFLAGAAVPGEDLPFGAVEDVRNAVGRIVVGPVLFGILRGRRKLPLSYQ
jgi:hypothetical protein